MITKSFTFVLLAAVFVVELSCSPTNKNSDNVTPLSQDELKRPLPSCNDIDGRYFRAFIETHKAFLTNDINPPNLRKVENYNISFREEGGKLLVDYAAKITDEEKTKVRVGGGSSLGASCTYILNKETYQIVEVICPK